MGIVLIVSGVVPPAAPAIFTMRRPPPRVRPPPPRPPPGGGAAPPRPAATAAGFAPWANTRKGTWPLGPVFPAAGRRRAGDERSRARRGRLGRRPARRGIRRRA